MQREPNRLVKKSFHELFHIWRTKSSISLASIFERCKRSKMAVPPCTARKVEKNSVSPNRAPQHEPAGAAAAAEELERIAAWLRGRRLEVPAAIFLEMNLPLTAFTHTATLLFQPLLTPLFGTERIERLSGLLADRSAVRRLIELLDRPEGDASNGLPACCERGSA